MSKGKKSSRKIILWLVAVIAIVGLISVYKVFGPNTGDMHTGEYAYIRTGATYDEVEQMLATDGFISDLRSFRLLAKQAGYPSRVYAGKYKINKGMSNYNMVRMLRSARQTPVKLVINKLRTKKDLLHLIGSSLEADSIQLDSLMNDNTYMATYRLDSNTAMCAILPDTYEFFWNTSADKAFEKIAKYYKEYWSTARMEKAEAKKLTPAQISIIASIVDEETNKNDEKGNVASVYINRYRTGMKLQADPTVKFAVGDFTIRRITGAHLSVASPYNTYMYSGLPPGPICTPSKKSIEAVLNAPNTKYIYFCAKEDFSGYHNFASNYADHMKNAKLYQQALNARNIR